MQAHGRTGRWRSRFVTLGVTGLILTFGKAVLLPLIGYTLFSWLATIAKNVHNFIGPILAVAVPVFIVLFVRHNLLNGRRRAVARRSSAACSIAPGQRTCPSGKFNAGEKVLFWLMVVVLSAGAGRDRAHPRLPEFQPDPPDDADRQRDPHDRGDARDGDGDRRHIYLGTIGMRGAFEAMRYGYVDETWAKEHHEYWYNDVVVRQGGPRRGAEPPAPLAAAEPA